MSYTAADAERAARDPGALREDEPPLLRFEKTTMENRPASQKEGRYVHVPVVKVHVKARGDTKSEVPYLVEGWRVVENKKTIKKDTPVERLKLNTETGEYERVTETEARDVEEIEYELERTTPWLDQLRERLHHGRISKRYFDACMQAYERWKANEDSPVDGIPLTQWNGANPALIKNAMEIGIRSVEEAAQMTEEAITALGMGARQMKQDAQNYLKASDQNMTAAEIAKSNERAEQAEKRASALEEKLAEIEKRLDEKPKGRKKKEEPEAA